MFRKLGVPFLPLLIFITLEVQFNINNKNFYQIVNLYIWINIPKECIKIQNSRLFIL